MALVTGQTVKNGRKFVAFLCINNDNMKTMLILTDFSEAAFRAAEYGCELAGSFGIKRIILYHAYQPVMAYAGTPAGTVMNNDEQQVYLESMESLGMLQDRLRSMVEQDLTIDLVADAGLTAMADSIDQLNNKEGIDMIVMGVSGKSGLEKFLLGSTTSQVLREGKWPVLIVPENTLLGRGIKTIVLTSDLKDVDTLPVRQLNEFLEALPAKLQVVNVQPVKEKYDPEIERGINDLHKLLEKYYPSFNYINGNKIVEELLDFAEEKHASLIIAVHQEHGFLTNLFHKSVTKKLAYNSNVPLLSLPALKTT
jgi:nucleotide-binding universal stress UspA family protein